MSEEYLKDVAIILLRLSIGPCFIIHALGKLGLVGPGNMEGFTGWLKSLGVPFPKQQAQAAMLTELVGGACVTLGLFYQPALLLLFGTMVVATVIGHKGGGYLITNNPPGREYALNLAIICIVMLLLGPGQWSLDTYLF